MLDYIFFLTFRQYIVSLKTSVKSFTPSQVTNGILFPTHIHVFKQYISKLVHSKSAETFAMVSRRKTVALPPTRARRYLLARGEENILSEGLDVCIAEMGGVSEGGGWHAHRYQRIYTRWRARWKP